MNTADLEIGLFRRDEGKYAAELRYMFPESDVDIRRRSKSVLTFDFDRLRSEQLNHKTYGQLLSDYLFADKDIRASFIQARNDARIHDIKVRMRLFIGPYAPELHEFRWETLRDPEEDRYLFTRDQMFFSRYLSSYDWRPVRLRARGSLRGLIAIASPSNLNQYEHHGGSLHNVDTQSEVSRATNALDGFNVTTIAKDQRVTLKNIFDALAEGYDFIYLVCHGAIVDGSSYLWLEDENGEVDKVPGREFLNRLRDLQYGPRLVVLASCQSGGSGDQIRSCDDGTLAALGPKMAATGTPAVVAMQGNITAKTLSEFMSVMFRELQADGQIDRAMALARNAVKGQSDWWVPSLFMRLKSGRIWYSTGFPGSQMKKWPALLANINEGDCTPILGPGLVEPIMGSRREIAQGWAEKFHFPMSPHLVEDLPQVAQYLATDQQLKFPQQQLIGHAKNVLLNRYRSIIGDHADEKTLSNMISTVGEHLRDESESETHRVLAELPLSIFITTNFSNLMADALKAAGKDPVVEFCRWKDNLMEYESVFDEDREPDYRPSLERPLVYHLFGHLEFEKSLVLTEDDYFDYLIGVTRKRNLIPSSVRRALTDRALLILGYNLGDWDFRVLLRSFLSFGGAERRSDYAHVAAQIDPEENRILEPEQARDYLETYFLKNAEISIFWGNALDFSTDLGNRLK